MTRTDQRLKSGNPLTFILSHWRSLSRLAKLVIIPGLTLIWINQAQAGLLINGGFEAATNATTLSYISLNPGSTNIPGWTTANAELTWDGPLVGISPPLTAAQGSDFLDLTGLHDAPPYGAVFQTITTSVGQQYQVSFDLGSDKYYDSQYTGTFSAPVVSVSLNGVVAFSAANNFPTLTNYWQNYSFNFTATAASTTLKFTGITASRVAYIGLDNVSVTGPPAVVIVLSAPAVMNGHAQIPFTLPNTNGGMLTYELLQTPQLNGQWLTNHGAVLATNIPGYSYTFTVPTAGTDEFYRVQSP
jgi:hypothetical protein